MSTRALLLIDVQRSFEQRPYWTARDLAPFQRAVTELIEGFRSRGWPIVRVLHVEPEGAFALESGLVAPMLWMPDTHDVVFHKRVHNAFTDTDLDGWLRARSISRIAISGIRTEQCCETTARVASDLGYVVDFVTEATLTFPMQHPLSGKRYSVEELKERTELVLAERFARIRTVSDCLDVG